MIKSVFNQNMIIVLDLIATLNETIDQLLIWVTWNVKSNFAVANCNKNADKNTVK